MYGNDVTRFGRILRITNLLLSIVLLISLSLVLVTLILTNRNRSEEDNNTDLWNDDKEIDKVCGFDKNPVIRDNGSKYGKLRWIGALFRHGDRTPIWFLDDDPYKDYSWPEGHEMLTNIGRRRMFCYGVALRKRYSNYLESVKTSNVIAFSSWYRRTIETNDLVLAGMFPPNYQNSWAPTLKIGKQWQTIGVGSAEFSRSWMLLDEAKCPKAEKIQNDPQNRPKLSEKQKVFLEKLKNQTGANITTVDDVYHIYDTLFIEKAYFGDEFQEPDWISKIGSDTMERMKEISDLSFNQHQDDLEVLRLRSGVFLEHLNEISKNVTNHKLDLPPMVHTFSSHDTTIAFIIQALGLYEGPPSYGSGIVIEIRQPVVDKYVIRLIYSDVTNHNDFKELNISKSEIFKNNCSEVTCEAQTFFNSLSNKSLLIKHDAIQNECSIQRSAFYEKKFFPDRKDDRSR